MAMKRLTDDDVARYASLGCSWPDPEASMVALAAEVQEWRRSNLADVLAELDAANAYIDDLEHQIRDLQRSDTLNRAMPT